MLFQLKPGCSGWWLGATFFVISEEPGLPWLPLSFRVFWCLAYGPIVGMYKQLAEVMTEQYQGHADVIHVDYEDDQKLEQTIQDATETHALHRRNSFGQDGSSKGDSGFVIFCR